MATEALSNQAKQKRARYDWAFCHQALSDYREEFNRSTVENGLPTLKQQHFHTALRVYDKYMKLFAKGDRMVTTVRHRPGGEELSSPGFHTNGAMLIKELGQYDCRTFDAHLERLQQAGICWRLRQHGTRKDGEARRNRASGTWNSIIALNPKFLKLMDD